MLRTVLFWIIAFLITALAAVYQKKTGPTYPKSITIVSENNEFDIKLIRSHGGESNLMLNLEVPDASINGELWYRRYPTNEEWIQLQLQRDEKGLNAELPKQPAAGKLEYKIKLIQNGNELKSSEPIHTVVRFKGHVPAGILIPHIFFIFFAMLLSNLAAIMAIFKHKQARTMVFLTTICLTLGGMIFGPIVQWYAFGDFWTGVPFGWDLTDNKTLIAFIGWLIALYFNRKELSRKWIIIAAIITLGIFSIPHSMFGSELNYQTGEVTQG